MAGARPSIFGDDSSGDEPGADIDLSGFAPKRTTDKPAVPDTTVRRTSEEGGFPSRPARPQTPPLRRPVKSGRTVLLNARITQRAHDRFHAIWRDDGFEALARHIAEADPSWLAVYLELHRRLHTDAALRRKSAPALAASFLLTMYRP